jgi:hypothetical protein
MRSLALVVTVSIAAAACAPDPPPAARESTHSPTPRKRPGLCQPFPDRLIDDLLAAYNGRDEAALKDLVTATQVHDFAAVGHAGTALFEDAVSWARAGWEADDRLGIRGYSAFSPTEHGFQTLLVRRNDALRQSGIPAISFTLDAKSVVAARSWRWSPAGPQRRSALRRRRPTARPGAGCDERRSRPPA